MLKFLLIALIILFIIILLWIIWIKNRRQVTQTFSIPAFMGNSFYHLKEEELNEPEKSFIEKVNDFFNDSHNDGDEDIGDSDDAGD